LTEVPSNPENGQVRGEEAALESVRRLEGTLEDRRELREAAEASLAAAREEAQGVVREARNEALKSAEEYRLRSLAEADEEAARILDAARTEVDRLRSLAKEDRPAAARLVVESVLPGEET
jgi:vacuolar-type H+-ATPase subunit H